jgi:hypothetical protein
MFMNDDLNADKTARHESISHLGSSAFVENEDFDEIRRELRPERRKKNMGDGI